ncbi:hypothetical protein CSB45_07855 [candidate division KSB3 bacterium]|uniref:Uncharacterized protein n=1 Tax=candidate division KSB3 bacterium TaxID=2044937 RepID=A0A2G6E5S5_9BACT|nr:MAG: hypothetical protein CSB45_07855 [candidate division KSB3 bacterium]PIE29943.1 MAG: hypothetical protein CSA57_06555 [candidate division KSB3 bacterium]
MKHKRAGRLASVGRILLGGCSLGTFFALQTIPSAQIFHSSTTTADQILWGIPPLAKLSVLVLAGNLVVCAIWLLYAYCLSKRLRQPFVRIAVLDSYSYLPFALLLLLLIQFSDVISSNAEGLLLLLQWKGYFLLVLSLLGVWSLKRQLHRELFFPKAVLSGHDNSPQPSRALKVALLLTAFCLYAFVGFRFSHRLSPNGDEPHYLLITHSLLHDRDLAISNNYAQHDYKTFYPNTLDPHVSIARDGTRYSIHPIGVSVLLLPFYALFGYKGAVLGMNFMAALLSLVLFLIAYSLSRQLWNALLLCGIVSLTPPLFLYSSAIYPEVPAALFLASAYYIISTRKYLQPGGLLLFSVLQAGLPWLQPRMIVAAVLLLCYHLFSVWRQHPCNFRFMIRKKVVLLPAVCLAVSGLLMAAENMWRYHSPFPHAAYHSVGITKLFSGEIFLQEGALGLLFDQEAGVLIYAPYLVFCFAGALFLWKKNRPLLVFCLLVIAGIYIPCAGFTMQWRGASSPVARYMLAQLPAWYILLTISTASLRSPLIRGTFLSSAALSLSWSVYFFQNPALAVMRNSGINHVFERESFFLSLIRYFPSFSAQTSGNALLTSFLLVIVVLMSFAIFSKNSGAIQTAPSTMDARCRQHRNRVFLGYGLLIVCCGFWTVFTIMPAYTPNVSLRQRDGLYHLFSSLNYSTLFSNRSNGEGNPEYVRFALFTCNTTVHSNESGPRFVVSGPREAFLQGQYTAGFELAFTGEANDDIPLAKLEVVSKRGIKTFSSRTLFARDFPHSGQYELFSFPVELPVTAKDLETRVFFFNHGQLEIRKIFLDMQKQELYYQAAIQAIRAENRALAETLLNKINRSRYPRSFYYLALIEQSEKHWAESLELLDECLAHLPDFADAHYRKGLAYRELHKPERAEESFHAARDILPQHLESLEALQQLYLQRGMPLQAQISNEAIRKFYAPQHPMSCNFNNQIQFMGYTLQPAANKKFSIEYYWQALDRMSVNYAFFVHFRDGTDIVFQQDHFPRRWLPTRAESESYPTRHWKIGELVHERYEIPLPSGSSELRLGVWDPNDSKQRLAIRNSSGQKCQYELQLEVSHAQ